MCESGVGVHDVQSSYTEVRSKVGGLAIEDVHRNLQLIVLM